MVPPAGGAEAPQRRADPGAGGPPVPPGPLAELARERLQRRPAGRLEAHPRDPPARPHERPDALRSRQPQHRGQRLEHRHGLRLARRAGPLASPPPQDKNCYNPPTSLSLLPEGIAHTHIRVRSSGAEHSPFKRGVEGSNPSGPIYLVLRGRRLWVAESPSTSG